MSTAQPKNRWLPDGSSKLCIWTSSSLTAICRSPPPLNSVLSGELTGANRAPAVGSPSRPPQQETSAPSWVPEKPVAPMPTRAPPMPSNSSMKPMAPPSLRAILRSALK